jgi:hypothetical protein
MVLAASVIAAAVGLAPSPPADFYIVIQECTVTVASLEPDRRLVAKPFDGRGVKRCSREGRKALCRAQVHVGDHLVKDPAHVEADEYYLLPDTGSASEAPSYVGASWMTLNTTRGTVVTGVMGLSPATEDPDSLDTLASWVCRGVLATSDDGDTLQRRNGSAQPPNNEMQRTKPAQATELRR